MPPSRSLLDRLEVSTGFQFAWLEKAIRLQEVLAGLQEDHRLHDRLALKGGTALNFCYLGLARLSIDLDFNYIGSARREDMLRERPEIEERIERLGASMGYGIRRLETGYAASTWSLGYTTARGGPDALRVQVNYLHRIPLFGTREVRTTGFADEPTIVAVCVSPEELVGGKVKALVERAVARDLYDVYRYTLNPITGLDSNSLRVAFVVLAATLPTDAREVTLDALGARVEEREIRDQLLPLLRRGEHLDRAAMIATISPFLRGLLEWSAEERVFLDAVAAGRIEAEHLTRDEELQRRIRDHPALRWKVENVAASLAGRRPPEGRRRGRPRKGS